MRSPIEFRSVARGHGARPFERAPSSRSRATPCSCRRPARASTCFATTSTAATSSRGRCRTRPRGLPMTVDSTAEGAKGSAFRSAAQRSPHRGTQLAAPLDAQAERGRPRRGRLGARGDRNGARRVRRRDGLHGERGPRDRAVPRPAVLLEAAVRLRGSRARGHVGRRAVDYHRLYKMTYPLLGRRRAAASGLRHRASGTRGAARRAGSRLGPFTCSQPRWPRWRW
jgi:hypothetical protein